MSKQPQLIINRNSQISTNEIESRLINMRRFKIENKTLIAYLFAEMFKMPLREMFPNTYGLNSTTICKSLRFDSKQNPQDKLTFGIVIWEYNKCKQGGWLTKAELMDARDTLSTCQFGFDVEEFSPNRVEKYPEYYRKELFNQSKFFKIDLKSYFEFLEQSATEKGYFEKVYYDLITKYDFLKDATIGSALRSNHMQPSCSIEEFPAYFLNLHFPEIAERVLIEPFAIYSQTQSECSNLAVKEILENSINDVPFE